MEKILHAVVLILLILLIFDTIVDIVRRRRNIKVETNKKWKKIMSAVTVVVFIAMLSLSITKLASYSKFINEDAKVLITQLDDEYYLSSSMSSDSEGEFSQKVSRLGGNVRLGTLSVTEEAMVRFSSSVKNGQLKLLIANDETEEIIYFDNLEDEELEMALESGAYRIYLVGSWYSGKCVIQYENAMFETYD